MLPITVASHPQSIFVELFKKGDIVEDLRPNIYDPVEGTTIADAEVERIARKPTSLTFAGRARTELDLVISTTRPEPFAHAALWSFTQTMIATATLLEPTSRYQWTPLVAKQRLRFNNTPRSNPNSEPVCSWSVPLGTKTTSRCSENLDSLPFQAIDLEGKMTGISGPLSGLTVLEARAKAIELLSKMDAWSNLSNGTKTSLYRNGGRTLLKLSFSRSGMSVKPTSRTACVSTLMPSPSILCGTGNFARLDGQHQHRPAH